MKLNKEIGRNLMSESDSVISVITCDTEGRIETFNESAEILFGYSADEIIGKKSESFIFSGSSENVKDSNSSESSFFSSACLEFSSSVMLLLNLYKRGIYVFLFK